MKKIWIDYMAPCDVFFFNAIVTALGSEYSYYNTARRHAETESLLYRYRIKARTIGEHDVSNRLAQLLSFTMRNLKLDLDMPDFDVSFSLANVYSIIVSKLRCRPSISVIDNDLIEYRRSCLETVAAKVHAKADWIIAPSSYPVDLTIANGANEDHVITFCGYKEDIYLADYAPNPKLLNELPFKEYIVIRPEALYSTYVHSKKSITSELLKLFTRENINIVFLPRHKNDLFYLLSIENSTNIFVPPRPLNGLDLVYYSRGVLTGSGTLAREAACMNQVAVSYFPDKLLAVDQSLIDKKKMFHSRDPVEIVDYVMKNFHRKKLITTNQSKIAKADFLKKIKSILSNI